MIIKAPEEIGGNYQSYAPGHGALAFVHVDANGKATNQQVPKAYAQILCPEGWKLADIMGRIEAYRSYKRLSNNTLQDDDGKIYRYYFVNDKYHFELLEGSEFEPLRNISRTLSLRYFIAHEDILTPLAAS